MTVILMDSRHALFMCSLQIKYTIKVAYEGATGRENIPCLPVYLVRYLFIWVCRIRDIAICSLF